MQHHSLSWEDVQESRALPPITYELSLLRMVAFVRATGLYDYIHFDRDYAQAVGMRDAIMATPHIAGLFSRLLTEWAGPDTDLWSMTISMKMPCCTNDILTATGTVTKAYRGVDGAYLVDVALAISSEASPNAVAGTATIGLPSRDDAAALPVPHRGAPPEVPNPDMPDFARPLIGKPKPATRVSDSALTELEMHLWCEALEDWNPLYWDKTYAAQSRHGGLVAPPAMGWFFGAGTAARAGIGYGKPGASVPAAVTDGLTGMPLLRALRTGLIEEATPFPVPGFPEAAVLSLREDYFVPIRPGDTIAVELELLNCSPLKRARVGEGHFLTFVYRMTNQHGVLTKTMTLTLFHYRPDAPSG